MPRLNHWFNFVDINDCAVIPCLNGGTCSDGVNSYTCSCAAGFTGKDCETSKSLYIIIGYCRPNFNIVTLIKPKSALIYQGIYVKYLVAMPITYCFYFVDINECAIIPCLNGGTCTDGVNNYTCSCAAGFTGNDCETSKLEIRTIG